MTMLRLPGFLCVLAVSAAAWSIEPVAPDRSSPEYRALSETFDLIDGNEVSYWPAVPMRALTRPAQMNAMGTSARAAVFGPGANPWNTPGDFTASEATATADEAPWGGLMWVRYFAYQPKLEKPTNPYQDTGGNPASLCWMWSYPTHRVLACAWWDGDVDRATASARVRPIAEALHRGMIAAGLAAAGAAEPTAASRQFQAIIEWPSIQPGDWLTPTVRFVDQHGQPPRDAQSIVWRIGGRETPSIIWDGNETLIELQASVEHQALVATRTVPAWGAVVDVVTDAAPAADTTAMDTATAPVLAPLPGPLGWLPLPESWTQGLIAVLAPAALVWLGSLFGAGATAPVRAPSGAGKQPPASEPRSEQGDAYAPNPGAQLAIAAMPIFTTPPPLAAHQDFAQKFAKAVAPQSGHFSKATWEAASESEREQWSKALLDQMQGTLKLAKPVRLEFEDLKDKTYAGYYSQSDPAGPKVVINKPRSDFATRPGEVIDTIAHEVRHACQWDSSRPLESPEIRNVCTANQAAGSYVAPESDFPSYAEQFVEKDATAFAGAVRGAVMTEVYTQKLDTLLQTMAAMEPKHTTLEQIQAFLWENPQHKAAIKQAWSSGKLVIKGAPKPP